MRLSWVGSGADGVGAGGRIKVVGWELKRDGNKRRKKRRCILGFGVREICGFLWDFEMVRKRCGKSSEVKWKLWCNNGRDLNQWSLICMGNIEDVPIGAFCSLKFKTSIFRCNFCLKNNLIIINLAIET